MADLKLHVDMSELDAATAKAERLSAMLDDIEARFAAISPSMKFAQKERPDCMGFTICNAATGEHLPGQVSVDVSSEVDISTTEVTLRFHNLPLFKG